MRWSILLLLFAIRASTCAEEEILTQPGDVLASVGGTARLPCVFTSKHKSSTNTMRWYQIKPESPPKFVYQYYTSSDQKRGADFPERFSVSPVPSKNLCELVITGVKPEDEANYYCSVWSNPYIFGPGTKLTVPTGEVKAPALFIFGPSAEELQTDSCSTVCTATDFTPGAASIQWAVDGNVRSSGVSTTPIGKQSGSLYMVSSILTMPTSDYRGAAKITCKVTHQGKEMDKTLKTSECN